MRDDGQPGRQEARSGSVSRAHFLGESYDAVVRRLPVRDGLQTQIGPGRLHIDAKMVRTPDVALVQLHVAPRTISVTVPDPAFVAVILPLRWTGEYRINGERMTPSRLYLSAGFDGYYARGEQRQFVSIGLRRRQCGSPMPIRNRYALLRG